ncbi:hypothetical protein AAMO2058_000818800 [Amorphochlora amoebiformis]
MYFLACCVVSTALLTSTRVEVGAGYGNGKSSQSSRSNPGEIWSNRHPKGGKVPRGVEGRLEKTDTRRRLLMGIALAGLGAGGKAKEAEAKPTAKFTFLPQAAGKNGKESNIDRGIRALATAELQAVETVAEVEIDPNDGNEYWVLKSNLKKSNPNSITADWLDKITKLTSTKNFKVLKRKVSDSEVVVAGLVAGGAVEAARIALLHPLDTVKTRLQAFTRPKPPTPEEVEEERVAKLKDLKSKLTREEMQLKRKPPAREPYTARKTVRGVKVLRKISLEEQINTTQQINATEEKPKKARIPDEVFESPWDGVGVALVTSAPQGAVYWAVRDVVKRNLLQAAPAAAGGVVSNIKTSGTGVVIAKIAAVLAAISHWVGPLAPAIALDYRSTATMVAVALGEAFYWLVRTPGEILKTRKQTEVLDGGPLNIANPFKVLPGVIEVFKVYPILALVDLPQILGRVWVFLILHNSPHTPSAAETDLIFYTLSAMVAAAACTPLDLAERAGRAAAEATAKAIEETTDGKHTSEDTYDADAVVRPSENPRYEGIVDCLQQIRRDEGWQSLFAGVSYRIVWNGLVVGFILAIQRTSYEGVRAAILFRVLDQLNEIFSKIQTPYIGVHSPFLASLGLAAGAINGLQHFADHVSNQKPLPPLH